MSGPITLEQLSVMAESKGLALEPDELERLLPGVNRSRKQATELRRLVVATDEPAAKFDAGRNSKK
jgi:hypothetical protein